MRDASLAALVSGVHVAIERCTTSRQRGWLELRRELWPQGEEREHFAEMELECSSPGRFGAFIAYDDSGQALGFVEASVRRDYVNGTNSSPVGFIEGLHVIANARHQGIGRSLVAMAERWARANGCSEMASDALIGNEGSHAMHRALGFVETERVVYFRKELALED
jgi:aminoglycoside 6'-N-acetyltransferase I